MSVSAQAGTNASTEDDVAFIIEAETYAPAFYNGRPEPTPGSRVHVTGFVRNPQSNAYTFLFETPAGNDSVTTSAPFSTASFTMPQLDDVRVKMTVRDENGRLIGNSERFVAATTPRLGFFPQNLLRGMSKTAIVDQYRLIGDEVTIQAVPFFINTAGDAASYMEVWRRNGNPVTQQARSEDIRQLTIRGNGRSGTEEVAYEIYNQDAVTQYVTDSFEIQYE